MQAKVLVIDDEPLTRWSLRETLEGAGYTVYEAESGETARQQLANDPQIVLLDYRLPDCDGLTLLKEFQKAAPRTICIIFSAYNSVSKAVEAMRQGAYHYVDKRCSMPDLLAIVQEAAQQLHGAAPVAAAINGSDNAFDAILGTSPAITRTKRLLEKVATSPASTILLTGESGTGKDLAAKALHRGSVRAAAPFINITCSALPETLLESELFGHERGAFTDAKQRRKGLLELAHGGTVFLDEIGEMPVALQSKLLRFLEDKSFKRVGGSADVCVECRVIAATNRDLRQRVAANLFREDLLYRLMVLPVHLPPIRERHGDLEILVKHFIHRLARAQGKEVPRVSAGAWTLLRAHCWPGNVRELRNALERAMLLADGPALAAEDFGALVAATPAAGGFRLPAEGLIFEELERSLVVQALERSGGNQTRAGALLGMNRDQIRYRMEKFSLDGTCHKPHVA